ncbi:TetR/AcrR family transcriptional regulator [Enterococcus nangangensis]|uniref:TetR/AcrR family transcriptional regulator n=1 Tax=Enterococcus nangangensis TaxID=2559926 RepID=UPI0010F7F7D5|nr:TetR/AcrR family transcriptional regulator C-terminal domain-containing protein [Enterococcus nangangensis]
MAGTKNNRRTLYTKQVIHEAFFQLLAEKDFAKITITGICQKAALNRGTFYSHYADPQALFTEIQEELFQEIKPLLAFNQQPDFKSWLIKLLTLLQKNEPAARLILRDYPNSQLLKRLFAEVYDLACANFQQLFQEDDPEVLDYYFTYFVTGTIGTVNEWLTRGCPLTVEKLAELLSKAINNAYPSSSN